MENNNIWNFKSFPAFEYSEEEYFLKHRKISSLINSAIVEKNPAEILDIGCATGVGFKGLKNFDFKKIYGVDFVDEFIELFNRRGMTGTTADITLNSLPYESEKFDMVICNSILEHTLNPAHLVKEISRVMKPGGTLIIAVPNATSIRARWDMIKGRNNFRPLIYNLMNHDYLKRCSIFYGLGEIKIVLGSDFIVEDYSFIQELKSYKAILEILFKTFYSMFQPLGDVICVRARKL